VDDYRFHAQNVYALVMKTLAQFEFALGRRVGWSFDVHQLKIAPHGMMDANAFYSRDDEGLIFCYFPGSDQRTIHTCLSHDVIVHETTHALVDALRERYMDPSGPDQAAFHEGFADVIALLSVYTQPELVEELLLQKSPSAKGGFIDDADVSEDALKASALFGLADEMGEEVKQVRGEALRRSVEITPSRDLIDDPEYQEAHRRGEILVAALMHAFIAVWTRRIQAAKGKGQRQHAVKRVAEEGADIAAALSTMWIRALDYMPPVHITFGDALSAAITADFEVRPDDRRYGLRAALLEAFDAFGIAPAWTAGDPVGSWRPAPDGLRYDRVRFQSMRTDPDEVFRFLWDNREVLHLRTDAYTEVLSVRPCVRRGRDGFVLNETVAEYYQVARLTADELEAKKIRLPTEYEAALAGERHAAGARRAESLALDEDDDGQTEDLTTPVYGGGVLIFDEYGKLKYHVSNDVFGGQQTKRLQYLWDVGQLRAGRSGAQLVRARLSGLHRQRAIDARRFPEQGW
jgi:hypothetical protein